MSILKTADCQISQLNTESLLADVQFTNKLDEAILQKFAKEMKKIAPKANDFLYFSAIMMHAAEAALLDADGNLKKDAKGNPVEAYWEENPTTGSLKWVSSDPSIKPLKNANCLLPGTKILMEDGSVKNIENVEIGDYVITHNCVPKKVIQKYCREYDGNIFEFKIKGNERIYCTSEHPFYHVDFTSFNKKDKGLKLVNKRKKEDSNYVVNYKFSKAEDLGIGDLLTSPIVKTQILSDINPNKARLLGIFAAEGCFSRKYNKRQTVNFTLGITEEKIANLIKELFEEEFPECSVIINPQPLRSIIAVTVTGYNIPEYFYYHVGEHCHNKKLSKELCYSSNEIKKEFITGWIDGDGCLSTDNKLIGITVSPNLAYQIQNMISSMGISSSLRQIRASEQAKAIFKDKSYTRRDSYRLELYGETYKKLELDKRTQKYSFEERNVGVHRNNLDQNYFLHYITEKNKIPYKGNVYNLEVEDDHSFVANGIITHNCDSFPEKQLLKAYKNWAGKPLCMDHKSGSCDNVYGLIVDTYYDHKHKRIIALCALDKKTYPDLARKISTGVLNSVSMGTAVGKAICSDCGQVAKVESEYCHHMKTKSCYCEINIDLNPLELSLVVNGADRDAKIRHIVASAQGLEASISSTQEHVSQVKTGSITAFELSKLESEIVNLANKLDELKKQASEPDLEENKSNDLSKISNFLNIIENRLEKISKDINKLSSSQENKENTMNMPVVKEAYMQGTEEPKPHGTPQYPVDPMNDKIKNTEDKQLTGAPPFPGMGGVDGMHPGYQSFGESEEARKIRLKRAAEEIELRQLRRKEAMDKIKEAYMQGTEEPGKPYPVDPKNDQIKNKEDKQLTGAPPFPGVGKVDGLYGDDLAKKEKLSRAKKLFKFVPVANIKDGSINKDESQWQVFADDKLIISASVKEISGGKSELMYDHIASKAFGKTISETLKTQGYDATIKMLKSAQEAPAPAPTNMLAPPSAPAMPTAPTTESAPVSDMPDVMDKGEAGDHQNSIPDLINQMQNLLSDLAKAADSMNNVEPTNNLQEFDQLAEQMPKAAKEDNEKIKIALILQNKLPKAIAKEAKINSNKLSKSIEELKYASIIYKDPKFEKMATKKDLKEVNSLTKESIKLAKEAIADSITTLTSVIDYAKGNKLINKKFANIKAMTKTAQKSVETTQQTIDKQLGLTPYEKELQEKLKKMKGQTASTQAVTSSNTKPAPKPTTPPAPKPVDSQHAIDFETKTPDGSTVKGKADSLKDLKASKEKRAVLRAKLAEKTLQMGNMIDLAHPKGGPTIELNPKPAGDLAKVETVTEAHKKIEDLAVAPVKVKKAAEKIQSLVAEGKLDAKDVDALVAQGVDPEAVKYYKQYLSQAKDGGSQFAAELVKEYGNKKQAQIQEEALVKAARAWEIAEEMVQKGMLADNQAERKRQANEIMGWSDETFKNVTASMSRLPTIKKQASVNYQGNFPNIGSLTESGFRVPSTSVPDYNTAFAQAFATIKPGARSGR